jgi:pimeloyl-ACP methyl ester carboxylesterase
VYERRPCGANLLWIDLVQGQVVSSGHFVQLEVPEQVNAMIDRFLAVNLPASRGNA